MSWFSIRYLFCATGLGFLTSIWRHRLALKNPDAEPRKIIASGSFWIGLQRCMVYHLPSAASIAVIALNLKGFFIGFELAGIPGHNAESFTALQVTVKLEELLIVAGVATAVFQKLRNDLLHGRGLPFGLLGFGFSFTSLSYLWSPEFLVSMFTNSNQNLCALIFLAAILATFAGRATTVLVIPSTIKFAAGETHYFINGTKDVLWPDRVTLEHYQPTTRTCSMSLSCAVQIMGTRTHYAPVMGSSLSWSTT